MKKRFEKIKKTCLLITIPVLSGFFITATAQDIRWLRVTQLQSPINEIGAEYEAEFTAGNSNYFSWPAQYSINQNISRAKGLWIGATNWVDPTSKKTYSYKVVGSGPRNSESRSVIIFPQELKLIGHFYHPQVLVDGNTATLNAYYDLLDDVDPDMPADRMVLVKFNTSMGVSVTKRVMAFDTPNDDSYFVNDYVFKNTGIYNSNGDIYEQTLNNVWFYFVYRYAFAGVSSDGFGSTWGAFSSLWGASTLNHTFGENPSSNDFTNPASLLYQLRGFYSWYGPNSDSHGANGGLTYEEDWGCPNAFEDGMLGSAKYAGTVSLHADRGPASPDDDKNQPKTTWFIGSDIDAMQNTGSPTDIPYMADRYSIMSEGHPDKPHDEYVGDRYPILYTDPRRQTGGGTSQGQGYGPYTLAPGDSIHIVFAEGASGISWKKGREVGAKWLQWFKGTGQPELVMPDGSTTSDYNQYKRSWVETGRDSILQVYQNARRNYDAGYDIPKPPPPPDEFTVTSGGDRILLEWADNAVNDPNFDGYVIYRSQGNVMNYKSVYEKIFECNKNNAVHSFDDVTAKRGFDYYYYIQSKSDGSDNDVEPGRPLYSSLFWTITSLPANLQRPAEPSVPMEPDVDTTYWKPVFSAGTWSFGSAYNKYDLVSYAGTDYVINVSVNSDSSAPDTSSNWNRVKYTGDWVSGSGYHPYDIATFHSQDYVAPYAIPEGKGLELVRVVPNPYDIRSRIFQFGDESQYDRIAFYGLPEICSLKIFTERGDLIWKKDHTNRTGDELWDSRTSSGQIVASGIYILYVETPQGKSVYRKFVIIR